MRIARIAFLSVLANSAVGQVETGSADAARSDLLAPSGAHGPPRPILSIVPERTVWIADGVTQYRVTLAADNRPMNGEVTRAVQAQVTPLAVNGYQFRLVAVVIRPPNDFFAGFNMDEFAIWDANGGLFGRITFGGGPANTVGNFIYLWFTVEPTVAHAPPIESVVIPLNDDPSFTYFIRGDGKTIVSPHLSHISFVVSICSGDANGDNAVNFADLNIVLGQFGQSGAGLQGDLDGDGAVDFADLNLVLSNFGVVC